MTHTINETLERFTFVHGTGAVGKGTACMMTATAWRMGLAWTDTPACTHPIIRRAVIRLNDQVRVADLADAFRLLADPIIGTASLPDTRAAWCVAALGGNETMEEVAAFAGRLSDTISATDLIGANLRGADLRWANFEGANFRGADLTGAYLTGADLTGANFRGANLTWAYLSGAYLIGANPIGANLTGANLVGASLDGANFRGANLDGSSLGGAKASSSTVWPTGFDAAAHGVVTA